jgi:hypothetical protein
MSVARSYVFHGKATEFGEKSVPLLLGVLDGPGIEFGWG